MNKNFLTLLAITAVAPFAIAAAPLEQFRSVTSVQQQSAQLAATTNAKITTMSEQINGALATQSSALANAIRGAVAQEAVSATQIATADRNARVVQAEAKNASDVAQKLLDIKLKYGPQTGQGYAACKTLIENQQTDQAVTNATLNTKDRVVTTDNAAGRFSSSLQDFSAKRNNNHYTNFCTKEEYDQKLCDEVSDMPGLDTNAAVLFSSAKAGTKVAAAKAAVRENILGTPNIAIPANMGQTAQGQAYLYNSNRKSALSAFPAYSLAHAESMSEKRDDLKDSNGNPMSPNDLIFATVSRYYGSDEAKQWAKTMADQVPRGLLVELAKMEGVGAWMDNQEYETNNRIIGNLGSMTVIATLPLEEQVTRKRNVIARSSTAAAIKNSN